MREGNEMTFEYDKIDLDIDDKELEKVMKDLGVYDLVKDYFKDRAIKLTQESEDYIRMVKNYGK